MTVNVDPGRCIRTSEEMMNTRRILLHAADTLTDVCGALRAMESDSMQTVSVKIERYVSDIQREGRVAETMSFMLEKIAESYIRTENETHDFIDQIYIAPVTYGTVSIGAVTEKAKQYFEVF